MPLPFRDEAHALPFWFAYGLWLGSEIVRSRTLRSAPQSRRQDRGSYPILVGSILLAAALAFYLALHDRFAAIVRAREAAYAIGVVSMFAGIVFRSYAIRVLGGSFTFDVATRDDQLVCETGPYRWIRHPSYTGTLLTVAGLGLSLGNWASLVAALAVVGAAFAYRVRVEERLLCRALGASYVAYMERTQRFLPFLF